MIWRIAFTCVAVGLVLVRAQTACAQQLQTWVKDLGARQGHKVAFSPDGSLVAACDFSVSPIEIHIWDSRTRVEKAVLKSSIGEFHQLQFSPDGKTLVGADSSGGVALWDVPTGTLRADVRQREADCRQILFTADGKWIVSGLDSEPGLGVWDTMTGELRKDVEIDPKLSDQYSSFADRMKLTEIFNEQVHDVAFLDGGSKVVTAGRNGNIGYWEIGGKIRLAGIQLPELGPLIVITSSKNRRSLASIGTIGAFVWSVAKAKILRGSPIPGEFEDVTYAEFSSDGKILVAVGSQNVAKRVGAIRVWNVSARRGVWMSDPRTPVAHYAWSTDQKMLAYADDQVKTHIVDLNKRKELGSIEIAGSMSYSSDGKMLAIAGKPVKLVYFEEP